MSLSNASSLAPDMTVLMIEVGDSSGDLFEMLEDAAGFCDQEVENRLTTLTTMIEPVFDAVHRACDGDRGGPLPADIRNGARLK